MTIFPRYLDASVGLNAGCQRELSCPLREHFADHPKVFREDLRLVCGLHISPFASCSLEGAGTMSGVEKGSVVFKIRFPNDGKYPFPHAFLYPLVSASS